MKVEGPHLDPNGGAEVRLLEVGGGGAEHSQYIVVKGRRRQERGKICLVGVEKSGRSRFICTTYLLHEFQISLLCVKL